MLETFTGREHKTLQELHFNEYKNLVVETKAEGAEWSEYDPHLMSLKLNPWRPDIEFLDEVHLKPIRVQIKDDRRLPELLELIARTCNMNVEKLLV